MGVETMTLSGYVPRYAITQLSMVRVTSSLCYRKGVSGAHHAQNWTTYLLCPNVSLNRGPEIEQA